MNPYLFNSPRKSRMHLNEGYFWTDTIKDWKHLLRQEKYKEIIKEELQWLKNRNRSWTIFTTILCRSDGILRKARKNIAGLPLVFI